MKVIVCLDDNLGMMFNNRRQSCDGKLTEHILRLVNNNKIWMNDYTKQLFPDQENIIIDDNFMEKAEENDYCVVENVDILPHETEIQELILYFWNRKYPTDKKFDLNLDEYEQINEEEFEGNSHERITQKIYVRRNKRWEENTQPKRKLNKRIYPYYRSLL